VPNKQYAWLFRSAFCFTVSLLLSDILMMNSHGELITAAVWFLVIHLLRPLNCNPSKKRWLIILTSTFPFVPYPSTALFNSPEAHEIQFTHFSELLPCWFYVWDKFCLLEDNLDPITNCNVIATVEKMLKRLRNSMDYREYGTHLMSSVYLTCLGKAHRG